MERWFSNHSALLSIIVFATVAGFTVLVMSRGSTVLIPIIVAAAIWFALNGISDRLQQLSIGGRHMSRRVAIMSTLLITLILAGQLLELFIDNFIALSDELPLYAENIDALADRVPENIWALIPSADLPGSGLDDFIQQVTNYFASQAGTLATSFTNILTQAALIAIYVIFFFTEQSVFGTKVKNMFPERQRRSDVQEILQSITGQIQTYISIKTTVSLITAAASFAIMFVFGLNHAMVWTVLIFILNFIPNIGSIIAVAFPVLMTILQFDNLGTIAIVAISLFAVQLIVGNFVEPKMMGRNLNISPLVVLASLAIFGAIWGVTGMFLSVPLTVIVMIVCSHFDPTRPIAVLLSGNGYVYGVEPDETATA